MNMNIDMDAARQAFVEEVAELLQSMEDALLALENDPQDPESLHQVFRAMHTIKGTGGVFGYTPIVNFTHAVETIMDKVRAGEQPMTSELIATLFDCQDHTGRLVDSVVHADPANEYQISDSLAAAGNALLARLGETESNPSPTASPETAQQTKKTLPIPNDLWIISLDFHTNALRNGMDPLSFLRYLGSLGDIVYITTLWNNLPADDQFDPESCYLGFRIAFKSDADKPTIAAVFEFAEDDCDIRILAPQSSQAQYLEMLEALQDEQASHIGEILIKVGALTAQELKRALAKQQIDREGTESSEGNSSTPRKAGELLVEQGSVTPAVVEQALKTQDNLRAKRNEETRFIRVDAQRLGHLINLVGELVTSSAAIRVILNRAGLEDMTEVVDNVDYLVQEIRDNALELRMVPIGDSLSRFRRVVRDASKALGKDIDLVITGGDTELDKTVVERITDPLTHLIRNAVDHGIESPEVRQQHGKHAQGTIHINALHDSGHIVIQITDDGAGLNPERIRAKAEANGLIKPEQNLSEEETLRLIFEPGLSTKDEVSNLSGRGVGMGVVHRNIEALRGSVELNSKLGEGTTITIILPLTLAIIDGFLVGAGNNQYVIPLSHVVECVEMPTNHAARRPEPHYTNLRGEVLPFIRLTELFEVSAHRERQRESLVVVRFGHTKAGLVVDTLHGELQTVIKPMGKVFEGLKGVTGATVLGTGAVALILDVQELSNLAQVRAGFMKRAIKDTARQLAHGQPN